MLSAPLVLRLRHRKISTTTDIIHRLEFTESMSDDLQRNLVSIREVSIFQTRSLGLLAHASQAENPRFYGINRSIDPMSES